MRSEEEVKNCTTNGVTNETIIGGLISELETYKKAYELVCKKLGKYYCCDVYEELVECNGTPCVDCLKEYFIKKAKKENE